MFIFVHLFLIIVIIALRTQVSARIGSARYGTKQCTIL